jgi:flagellar protein FlaJ
MGLENFLPLAFAVLVLAFAGLTRVASPVDDLFTRIAFATFGAYVTEFGRSKARRTKDLQAAHVPTNYREYATRTLLFAAVLALGTGILGMYLVWGTLLVLIIPEATIRAVLPPQLGFLAGIAGMGRISVVELFLIIIFGCLTLGSLTGLSTYWYRWYKPRYLADERERQIEISMPMMVSFMYALSRSGMPFPKAMEILADNEDVYGHAAGEVRVAVRNMDAFGVDVITAVKTMARRSPSSKLQEFSENLSSVLQTGGSLSEFLHRQYQEYRQEAEAQQERLLEMIETLAEVYVTLGVAGPLFLITIFTMLGIAVADALPLLRILVYALLPLGNLGFIIYLSTVVDNLSRKDPTAEDLEIAMQLEGVRRVDDIALERRARGTTGEIGPRADGGHVEGHLETDRDRTGNIVNIQRLQAYKGMRELQRRLGSPLRTIVKKPTSLLWISFPLAVFLIGIRVPFLFLDGALTVRTFDDLLIQSLLLVFGTFAIAFEVHRRRMEAIERVIPDLLDRLASLNEAGMTFTDSLQRVRRSELGPLNEELDIVWQDIRWGADVETALRRFEDRVRTETVSRIVTLTTEAMKASGNLGTVLRIAAEQAKADRRLKQKRSQEMVTYLVVVYISFLVFLFIVGVMDFVLFPSLPDTGGIPNPDRATPIPAVKNLGAIDVPAYKLTFLHAAIIQGLFSGLIAGQLSHGDVRAGAKHVTILVALGYVALEFVIPALL